MKSPSDNKPESSAPLLQTGGLSRELSRVVLLVFAVVSLWQLAHQLVEILLMFAMVFLLAIILNSVVVWLENRGVRRGIAVGLIMLSFIGSIALGGWLVVPPALKQANQLVSKAPEYWKTIRKRAAVLEQKYPALDQLWPEFLDEENGQNVVGSREKSVKKSTTQVAEDEPEGNRVATADSETNSPTEEAPVPPDISSDEAETNGNKASKSSDEGDAKDNTDAEDKTVTRTVTTKTARAVAEPNPAEAAPPLPFANLLEQDALLGYAKSAFAITATLAGAVFVTVLGFLLLMFTLANPQALVGGLLSIAPENHREATRRSLARVFMQMTGWARATMMNGTITGVLTGVGLTMVGVQPALVFGICAFFGEFVPNVGPLVAAAPAIFVALSMGPEKAMAALGVIIFVQAIASNAINPLIMGREMKLHPVSITFFALAMGKLFGVAGAILAVPAAATSKILLEEFYLRPRGVSEATVEKQARGIVMNESGVDEPDD